MWPNLQEIADLVTFTRENLNENFIFCAVVSILRALSARGFMQFKYGLISAASF